MDELVVRKDGGELRIDGWMATGAAGEDDALDVRVRVTGWPAADFTRALAWDVDLDGPGLGHRDPARPARRAGGRGRVHQRPRRPSPAWPFDDLRVAATLLGTSAEVTDGAATIAGGRVAFRGTVTDDGTYDGEVSAEARGRGRARRPGRPPRAVARAGRRAGGDGGQPRAPAPRRRGRRPRRSRWGRRRWARSTPSWTAPATGRWRWTPPWPPTTSPPRWRGRWRAGAALRGGSSARSLRKSALDPYVRVLDPSFAPTVSLAAAASAQVRGPLARPGEIAADLELTGVEIGLPDYPVANRGPLALAVRDGRVAVERFHLAGEGTDLAVTGSAGLRAGGAARRRPWAAPPTCARSRWCRPRCAGTAARAWPSRSPGRARRRRRRARWSSTATGSGSAGSRTGSRTCAAPSPSTPAARSGAASPAPSAAARSSCPGRPRTRAAGWCPSTCRRWGGTCRSAIRRGCGARSTPSCGCSAIPSGRGSPGPST